MNPREFVRTLLIRPAGKALECPRTPFFRFELGDTYTDTLELCHVTPHAFCKSAISVLPKLTHTGRCLMKTATTGVFAESRTGP
jgi:hypothetical protein